MNEQKSQTTAPDDYIYYDSQYAITPFGMNNTGAVCWLNSILQMFYSIPALNKTMLDYEHDFAENLVATEYIKVLKSTLPNSPEYPPPDTSKLMIASVAILQAFMKQAQTSGYKTPMGQNQECVDEAFTMLIDLFDHRHVKKIFTNIYNLTARCTACGKPTSTNRDTSYKINMFTGLRLDSQVQFQNWLRVHPSRVDFWKCECGNKMADFDREEKLRRLSEVIIITFNKFYQKDLKWFPQQLRFEAASGPDLVYELVARIEHSGGMNGGHYWCHAQRPNAGQNDSQWHKFNDSSVSPGSADPTPATFIIAYHLMRPSAK